MGEEPTKKESFDPFKYTQKYGIAASEANVIITRHEKKSPKAGMINQWISNFIGAPVTPGIVEDDPTTKSGTKTRYPEHSVDRSTSVTAWPKGWKKKDKEDYLRQRQ